MRIGLIVSDLGMGGAQRVLVLLSNAWVSRGHVVSILCLDDGRRPSFFELDSRVRVVHLDLLHASRNLLDTVVWTCRRASRLRRAVASLAPDVVVSFMVQANVLSLLALVGRRTPVVVAERADPRRHPTGPAMRLLRRLTYPLARTVVVQGPSMADFFARPLMPPVRIIPNPVIPPTAGGPADHDRKVVAGLGRLDPEKGFDLLLRAFALVRDPFPDWRLVIHGEGPDRGALIALRDELSLSGRVDFPGPAVDVHSMLREAGIFALPSRIEGFPNALCEAMACGCPVVAFDSGSGPRDIIRQGVDGLLVPAGNVDGFARALGRLMESADLRRSLSREAAGISGRFPLDGVLTAWDEVLGAAPDGRRADGITRQ